MKRIVGLDLGTRTLGVAISDPLKISAQGLVNIRFEEKNYKQALRMLDEHLKDYKIDMFVLGNPLHMSGEKSESSLRSENFKLKLESKFKVKVVLWDERLTSVVAKQTMHSMNLSIKQKKNKIDEIAAIHILQGYLDTIK